MDAKSALAHAENIRDSAKALERAVRTSSGSDDIKHYIEDLIRCGQGLSSVYYREGYKDEPAST